MSEERRATPRFPASLAGELERSAGKTSISITRDVSSSGLLVLSRHEIATGMPVKLRVAFQGHDVTITGKVVRQEPVDPSIGSIWRFQVAVAVDPSPMFDQLMAELAELARARARRPDPAGARRAPWAGPC